MESLETRDPRRNRQHKRLWFGALGLAAFLGVFVEDPPYSLIPFVFFMYLLIPGPDSEQRFAERRARSRALRRSPAVRKQPQAVRPIRILDPVEDLAARADEPVTAHEIVPAQVVAAAQAVVAEVRREYVVEAAEDAAASPCRDARVLQETAV